MRILWVRSGGLLWPPNSGGKIKSALTIGELVRRGHEVHVASSYRLGERDAGYEEGVRSEFPGADVVYLGKPPAWRSFRGRLGVFHSTPQAVRGARSSALAGIVGKHLRSGEFDVAVCDFVQTAADFPLWLPMPAILHEHNVEFDRRLQLSKIARSSREELALYLESLRLRRFEAATVRRFHHTVAPSEADAVLLRQISGRETVSSTGTGVDTASFFAMPLPTDNGPLLVFTGQMNYTPNVDGARWFCHEVWPAILAAVPEARFRIVGRSPAPEVLELASQTVEVTGAVESVAPHLRDASVVVVPLRAGGGTRLKIYEAMAVGRPVVSTPIGAAGLEVRNGHDIVLAASAESMAAEIIALLGSPERAAALGARAAETGASHSWRVVGERVEKVLEMVVERRRPAAKP